MAANDNQAQEQALAEARQLALDVRAVLEEHPNADPENVRHALILLNLPPEERLARALIRGRLYKHTAE